MAGDRPEVGFALGECARPTAAPTDRSLSCEATFGPFNHSTMPGVRVRTPGAARGCRLAQL